LVVGSMPITYRIVADTAEELAEPFRSAAKQDGGKFVYESQKLPDGYEVGDTRPLKTAFEAEKARRRDAVAVAQPFIDAGLSPEKARAAVDALMKVEAGSVKSSDELEKLKATLTAKFEADLRKAQEERDRAITRSRDRAVESELSKIIAAKGGSEALDILMREAKRRIRVEEAADGSEAIIVVGPDGKTPLTTKKMGSAEPMGLEELVDTMRDAPGTKPLFRVQAVGGAGSTSQSGGAARHGDQEDLSRLSPAELIARGNRKTA
jgi:hypothetical protein